MSVDVKNKISKSMLIIKSNPNSLKAVEQFLKNRDWFLASTDKLKEAIVFLAQNKPSFVLISVDHPSPKVRKFPKVIEQAFPCCVMMFAERATTASFKLLLDTGMEYKINPPITGPAIERAVNKYIRDKEQAHKKSQGSGGVDGEKSDFEFSVEIKSEGEKKSSVVAIKGEGKSESATGGSLAQKLLAQLGSDDDAEDGASGSFEIPSSQKKSDSSMGWMPQDPKTGGRNEGDLSGLPGETEDPSDSSNGRVFQLRDQNHSKSNSDTSDQGGDSAGDVATLDSGRKHDSPGSGEIAIDPKTGRPRSGSGRETNSKQGQAIDSERPSPENLSDFYIPTPELPEGASDGQGGVEAPQPPPLVGEDSRKSSAPDGTAPSAGKQAADVMIGRSQQKQTKRNQDTIVMGKRGVLEPDSVFVKGVNQALDNTAVKGSGNIEQELEDSSHLACIVVESSRFSGYLVAALGKNKKIDSHFVDLVRVRLAKFLKDNGEPIEEDKNMQIKVKRVDFEGWALEYAQFLRKSVHNGDEVAMAFFPFADVKTKVGDSAQSNMVSVSTEEIQTEVPLEFNVYIYLPTNKKYILYTPQGGLFLTEQKSRLTRQGVDKVHIQKEDVQNLGKSKAQNHLNSLIDEFDTKKNEKKKKKAA